MSAKSVIFITIVVVCAALGGWSLNVVANPLPTDMLFSIFENANFDAIQNQSPKQEQANETSEEPNAPVKVETKTPKVETTVKSETTAKVETSSKTTVKSETTAKVETSSKTTVK